MPYVQTWCQLHLKGHFSLQSFRSAEIGFCLHSMLLLAQQSPFVLALLFTLPLEWFLTIDLSLVNAVCSFDDTLLSRRFETAG